MNPPPYDPIHYYNAVPVNPRPTSVTVLAVLGIIFAALGLICSPLSLVPYFVKIGPPNPAIDAVRSNTALMTWIIASVVIGFLLAALLLAGSIASLKLRLAGQRAMILYAKIAIAMAILGFVVNVVWMMPAMSQGQQGVSKNAEIIGGMIGGLIGGLLALIYPICILVYMNKSHVKAAFGVNAYDDAGMMPPPQ